jgi:hypothetical protein
VLDRRRRAVVAQTVDAAGIAKAIEASSAGTVSQDAFVKVGGR